MKLAGKCAVITGAASGIGQAIALRFASEGAHVVLADIDQGRGSALEREILAQAQSAMFVEADIADAGRVGQLADTVERRLGKTDILCNCAGYFRPASFTAVADTSVEEWSRTLAVNLTGAFLSCRAFLPSLTQGGGCIIQIASIGGLKPFPNCAPYVASKAGLIGLTLSLARDYAGQGVRANAICPGAIDTPGNQPFYANRAEFLEAARSCAPMRRAGRAEEVAAAALYLASDEAAYVTGTVLTIDGGRVLM